jgi:mono/diheme cytochrome c family protein
MVNMRYFVLAIGLGACLAMAGCSDSRKVETLDQPAGSDSTAQTEPVNPVVDGRRIFLENCTGCHGKNADADTPAGRAWKVPDLRSGRVQALSDDQLQQILRHGKGRMPAWDGLLSQREFDRLVVYIRSLSEPAQRGPRGSRG